MNFDSFGRYVFVAGMVFVCFYMLGLWGIIPALLIGAAAQRDEDNDNWRNRP